MFAFLAAVTFAIAALIYSGAVSWPHVAMWFMIGLALWSLHAAFGTPFPAFGNKKTNTPNQQ